jgi:hypothetical protein
VSGTSSDCGASGIARQLARAEDYRSAVHQERYVALAPHALSEGKRHATERTPVVADLIGLSGFSLPTRRDI